MKVVLFSPGLNIGGIERVFINYANLLSDEGYEVVYLTCHENGIFENLFSSKVHLCNLKTNDLKRSIFSIVRFFRKEKPDYIVTANSATIIILLAKWLSISRVKIIASHHNYINVDINSIIDKKILWKVYNLCHKVIAISDGIYKLLLQNKVSRNKLVKINNPVDFDRIRLMSRVKISYYNIPNDYILFVGRLSKVKNIELLIRGFSQLPNKGNLNLVILGDGPEYDSLNNLCENLNLDSSVIFGGSVENPYSYMRKAKIVALSSESEAYPTVLLESLVLGKTIVSTPTNGAIEILHNGELGYISKSFELDDYANILKYSLENIIDENTLAKRAMDYYSPKKIMTIFEEEILSNQ